MTTTNYTSISVLRLSASPTAGTISHTMSANEHTWLHSGSPACGWVLPAGKEAIKAHNAEEQVIQMEGLYAVADSMCVCPQEVSRHCLECLKGVSILLQQIDERLIM